MLKELNKKSLDKVESLLKIKTPRLNYCFKIR